jgi:hypothetical protein
MHNNKPFFHILTASNCAYCTKQDIFYYYVNPKVYFMVRQIDIHKAYVKTSKRLDIF